MNPKGTAEGMDSDGPPNPTCPTCGKSKEGEGNNDVNWGRHINACSKKAKQVEEKKKQKIKNQLKKSSSAGKRKTVDTSGCAKHFDLKYCLGRIQK